MKKVAIAGASGFIGSYLIQYILDNTDYSIIALSRSEKKSDNERVIWKKCDLFSVYELEQALAGVETTYYLVHSMQPSAHLDQADFIDYDLILADNFGRAAKFVGVNKVIYLSGLMPRASKLSKHLLSRLEVEEVLKEYFENFIILRAGLILGKEGSSFNILMNLIKRLPIVVCPKWGKNLTSPVYLQYVIKALGESLINDDLKNNIFDLSSKNNVTYLQLLKLTAKKLNRNRIFFLFPFNIFFISRLWVSFFSGASKMLVYPLLESLSYNMVARDDHKMTKVAELSVDESLDCVLKDLNGYKYKFSNRVPKRNTVRSVQRFSLPPGMNGNDIAKEYMSWLPHFLYPFILVDVIDDEWVHFSFLTRKLKLLILHWSSDRSTEDRYLFYIKGGLLSGKNDKGRLEFREVLNNKFALAAVHEFTPALPWYIYCYTQAIAHIFVMKSFGKHLERISKGQSRLN